MNYILHPNAHASKDELQNSTPTSGINYNYVRFQPSSKIILHNIYEIGGGIININLIKSIINEKSLKNTVFLICLDLKKQSRILSSLKAFLTAIRKVIGELTNENQELLMEITEMKRARYSNENTNDLKRINIFPAEVIVVGTKYDILEKVDMEKLKWVCRCLRFFTHINALSLVFVKPPFNESDQKQIKIVILTK